LRSKVPEGTNKYPFNSTLYFFGFPQGDTNTYV